MSLLFDQNYRTTNNYGPTRYVRCAHCQHVGYCNLFEFRTWLAVCSLPLFLHDSRYYLLCVVCAKGERLYGDEVAEAKRRNATLRHVLNLAWRYEQTGLDTRDLLYPPVETHRAAPAVL